MAHVRRAETLELAHSPQRTASGSGTRNSDVRADGHSRPRWRGGRFGNAIAARSEPQSSADMYLLLRELGREGSIVIRRSSIKYQEPVTSSEILARCLPIAASARQYFLEMLDDKGQAKLDLIVEVAGSDGPSVVFNGSYVVLPNGNS